MKNEREIKETIRKAEINDWSMAMTADLINHSVDCTSGLCLYVNGRPGPMQCTCGRGIAPNAEMMK